MTAASITAIITTHNRVQPCLAAVDSALRQEPPPLEVLVFDDASTDGTPEQLSALAATEPRLRYQRYDAPQGTPARGRNDGIEQARGDWVAFLDDDDRWLPGKLARQLAVIERSRHDLVGTNALRSDGRPYFAVPPAVSSEPTRSSLLRVNPLIVSSVAVRRDLARAVGGFDARPWMGAVADYDLWLRLSDAGARPLVLGEPLIFYEDAGVQRYSSARLAMQRTLVRHGWQRWRRRPRDLADLDAALRRTSDYALIAREELLARRAARRAARSRR
jgi:glycosyltransferase involved in cell wall biosynthesis